VKGRTTLRKDGTVSTELIEHSSLDKAAIERLKKLLTCPELHENLRASLQVIVLLAVHAKRSQEDPAICDALTIIAMAADIAVLVLLGERIGTLTSNDFTRILFAALEVLGGRAMTAEDGVRIAESVWTMRVVDVLDGHRAQYRAGGDEGRGRIVNRVQKSIFDISGRTPDAQLVANALSPASARRSGGSKRPTLLQSYQEVLKSVGLERSSEQGLKKMRQRHKSSTSH
jgi:hypothetical protein